MNVKVRDAGGRPPKQFVRDHIINILSKNSPRKLTPFQVHREYEKKVKNEKESISAKTISRRMNHMWKEEKVLDRFEANEGKQRRLYQYKLRTE